MKARHLLTLVFLIACGSKSSGSDGPAKPHTGAPVAFEVKSFKAGKIFQSELIVRAYNFSDRVTAGYQVMLRSYDASGKHLPFDAEATVDHESFSFAGPKFKCAPKSWCEFSLQPNIPDGTAKIVVLANLVTPAKADGLTPDTEPMFKLEGDAWPEPPAAVKPS